MTGYQKLLFYAAGPSTYPATPFLDEPPTLAFRACHTADFSTSPVCLEKNRKEIFTQRLALGHTCYGYFDPSGILVAYFWVSKLPISAVPFGYKGQITLGQNTIYIWDCRTTKAFQGQGLYTDGLRRMRQQFLHNTIWIHAEAANTASIKGILKSGFLYKKTIYVFKILGMAFYWDGKFLFSNTTPLMLSSREHV